MVIEETVQLGVTDFREEPLSGCLLRSNLQRWLVQVLLTLKSRTSTDASQRTDGEEYFDGA